MRATYVKEIMTTNPTTVKATDFAGEVLYQFNSKKITNCFVLDGKKPIGIVHIHDLLNAKVA
jgi:arabinose-5-phosphate isomerase